MDAVCPQHTPAVNRRRGSSPQQSGEDDEQILLAEQLSEENGIPLDAAYSIVCRHFAAHVKEARQ
jgi:hypothetical protein